MASEMVQLILQAKDLASEAVGRLRSGMERLTETTQSYQSTVERLSGPVNQFRSTIATLAGAVGVAGLAKSFIDINASAEKTKLMLEGLTGSAEKADEAFQWILDFSTKAPFSIDALKDAFVKLQTAGLDPMSGSLQTLTDAIAAFGGSDEDLKLVSIAIQQMAGKGVVSMEELRQQIGERIPTAMQAMAQGMGMSMSQLSQAIEKGTVSAKQGLTAMMSVLQEMYGGRGQQMMTSWAGLISNVRVAWEKFMITLGESGVFERLKGIIDSVLRKIEEMKERGELKVWADRIASVVSSMITLFTTLAGIFAKVIDALGPFLPAIAETVVYFKTLQVVVGGFIGMPLRLVASIFALSDAFKKLMSSEIFAFFEKLKYMIYMNITASTALGVAMQAAMALGAAAVGYFIGQVILLIAENNKLKKINEEIEENTKALKERYDNFKATLSDVNNRLKETEEAYKQGKITSEGYSQAIHQLNVEKAALSKASVDSVTALTSFMSAIHNTDTEMKNVRKSFEEGKISAEEYYTTMDKLKQKKEDLFEKARALRNGLKDIDAQMVNLKESFDAGTISEGEFAKRTEELNAKKKQLIISIEKTATATVNAKKTYEDFISSLKEGTADYIAVEEKRIKTVEANLEYEKALLKKSYSEGQISREEYLSKLQELEQQAFEAHKKLIEEKIEFEKSKEEQDFIKIAELEEQKNQLILKHEAERINTSSDAMKEIQKIREDDLKQYESMQELHLKALQSRLELQNTIEETMVKQGLMRESELLENQLARYQEIAQEEIRIVEDKMRRLEEIGQTETEDYTKLSADRIRLQDEMAAKIIQSEQAIEEQRKVEEEEALNFIAKITGDRIALAELEASEKLKKLQQYYDQALISAEQYTEAVEVINQQLEESMKSSMKESLSGWTNFFTMIYNHIQNVKNIVSEPFKEVFTQAKIYVGDIAAYIEDVEGYLTSASKRYGEAIWENVRRVFSSGATLLNDIYLYGRDVTEMTAQQVEEWARQVRDYILYVQDLLNSLRDQIASYKLELMRLRGDRLGELEMWYEEEKKKLEEKYADELGKTEEYYEALALLDELYAEKKKQILDEMAKEEDEYFNRYTSEEEEKGKGSGGGPGIRLDTKLSSWIDNATKKFVDSFHGTISVLNQTISDQLSLELSNIPMPPDKVEVKKDISLESIFEVRTYDPDMTDKYIKDVFFPRFEEYLKLKGITLE